jgi:hypothetical protein
LAQESLATRGAFYPYAVKMTTDGEVGVIMADPGQGEHPRPTDVLSMLVSGLQGERDGLRAAATVADVATAGPPGDAIRVDIEHREGVALTVLLPYEKKRLRRGVSYGAIQAALAQSQIWPG